MKKIQYLLLFILFPFFLFGQFTQPDTITTRFDSPHFVDFGDIDGDSDKDMIFGFYQEYPSIGWTENLDGNGTWSAHKLIKNDGLKELEEIYLVDLNGDDLVDILACATVAGDDNRIVWIPNLGNGVFDEVQIIASQPDDNPPIPEISVCYGDIDNDGDMDLAASYKHNGKVAWYENMDGLGNFSDEKLLSDNLEKPLLIKMAHLNEDNFIDIVLGLEDGQIKWYENFNGLGIFNAALSLTSPNNGLKNYDIDDMDNDGDNDIVAVINGIDFLVYFENLDGAANFGPYQLIDIEINTASSAVIEDIDGDNDNDIITTHEENQLILFRNINGTGTFSPKEVIGSEIDDSNNHFLGATDLDGDNDSDIVLFYRYGDNLFFENTDGQGNFDEDTLFSFSPREYRTVYATDIDNDGRTDLVFPSSEPYGICWLKNHSDFVFEKPRPLIPQATSVSQMMFVDIDNNGFEDILYYSGTDRIIGWGLDEGQGTFTDTDSISFGNLTGTIYSLH